MYLAFCVLIFVVGSILLAFSGKVAKKNPALRVAIRAAGVLLLLAGVLGLTLLLSGKITLPLGKINGFI